MFSKVVFILLFVGMLCAFTAKDIDLNALAHDAGKQNKHLLVWLHKTDCSYCEAMREFTLEDESIANRIKKSFKFVHINVYDNDKVTFKDFIGDGKAFAKTVGYSFYPSSIFFDKHAEVVFAAPGYIEEKDFAVMLDFVSSKAYRKQGYDCFRRQEERRK